MCSVFSQHVHARARLSAHGAVRWPWSLEEASYRLLALHVLIMSAHVGFPFHTTHWPAQLSSRARQGHDRPTPEKPQRAGSWRGCGMHVKVESWVEDTHARVCFERVCSGYRVDQWQ